MPAPKNLIHETSTTTGTGNFTLSAVSGKIRFSDSTYGFGTGGTDAFDYFISHRTAAEWEIGTGHMSDANTLVRDTVVLSSNSNAAVDFSAGSKDVTNDVPAANQVLKNLSNVFTAANQFTTLEIGNASDTTLSRSAAGVLAVESVDLASISGTQTLTNKSIDLTNNTLVGSVSEFNAALESADFYTTGGTDVALADGGTGASLVDPNADRLMIWDDSAGSTAYASLSGLSFDATPTLINDVIGKQTIWIPASAMWPKVTNGAAEGTYDSGASDVTINTLDFDTTTQEFAHFAIAMPKGWNESTVTFEPYWTATSSSGTVVFGLAGRALSNDDAINGAFGTAQTSSDTLIATNDLHIGPESSAITIGNTPAENDLVVFEVNRTVASDTLAADALLIGIKLYITLSAVNDA